MRKTKEKNQIAIQRLVILTVIIVLIFIAIDLFWLVTRKLRFERLENGMDEITTEWGEVAYQKEVNGYLLQISTPAYLSYGGNMTVGNSEGYVVEIDESGNEVESQEMYISLYIWPKTFGEYEYGVDFMGPDDFWTQLMITPDIHYVRNENNEEAYNDEQEALITKYRDQIQELLDAADAQWNIL